METKFNHLAMHWLNAPASATISAQEISFDTVPHTDLWQRTYYHFRNDNAPMLQFACSEQFFSFSFKVIFAAAHQRFDQAGLVLYLDSDNWLKASVEYENGQFSHLGAVVTNGGFSDWSTQEVSAISEIYLRLSRRADDFKIEYSLDGTNYHQMRICHLAKANGEIKCGIYACSPEESSFKAIFREFNLGPCMWLAHDGQQPDEDYAPA